jgi:hypothetical protein
MNFNHQYHLDKHRRDDIERQIDRERLAETIRQRLRRKPRNARPRNLETIDPDTV